MRSATGCRLTKQMTSSSFGGCSDDERAFGVLVEDHREGLEVLCRLMLGDRELGERAMGAAVLTAWRERAVADASPSMRIWLYRIAVRVCEGALEVHAMSWEAQDRWTD
jgi:DNA-directed RNA polymerase specialized sigma24 family protein